MSVIPPVPKKLASDVVFYGMAGAGKTTQAELVAKHFGAHFFSIGNVLREIATHDDELGRKIAEHLRVGGFPDDATHYQIYREGAAQALAGQQIVFEGVGRLLRLKKILDQVETERHQKYVVVHLVVDEDTAVQRVLQQKKRTDQTPETILQRFRIYREETLPVIAAHAQERPIIEIDASQSLAQVTAQVISALTKTFCS